MLAYIGIGSNLEDPIQQVKSAIQALQKLTAMQLVKASALYCSPPMGPQDQPDYINAVVAIETTLSAMELLIALQQIEQAQGRVKRRHWGERSIDLDILLYGQQQINAANLTVPHPGLASRAFVLYPLAEIAADLTIPTFGAVADLLSSCPKGDLTQVDSHSL